MTPERLAELVHYARLRFAPAPQDSEAIRELLAHIDTITAERDAVEARLAKAEGLLCKFAWYKATIEDLIAARAIANAMKDAEARILELEK